MQGITRNLSFLALSSLGAFMNIGCDEIRPERQPITKIRELIPPPLSTEKLRSSEQVIKLLHTDHQETVRQFNDWAEEPENQKWLKKVGFDELCKQNLALGIDKQTALEELTQNLGLRATHLALSGNHPIRNTYKLPKDSPNISVCDLKILKETEEVISKFSPEKQTIIKNKLTAQLKKEIKEVQEHLKFLRLSPSLKRLDGNDSKEVEELFAKRIKELQALKDNYIPEMVFGSSEQILLEQLYKLHKEKGINDDESRFLDAGDIVGFLNEILLEPEFQSNTEEAPRLH